MKYMKYIFLLLFSLHSFLCMAWGNTTIYFDMDRKAMFSNTTFDNSMSYCDGYFSEGLKMFLIEKGDTCCVFSSIGITQFSSNTTELGSTIDVFCWPNADTKYEQGTCEDQPRAIPSEAPLTFRFKFESDSPLVCNVCFIPEKYGTPDNYSHDIDSVLRYPHYFADNISDIVYGQFCNGKDKQEVETFLDAFDKSLDPSMLDREKGYGEYFGYSYGYRHYRYTYYLLKALLHLSNEPYVGKDIAELNRELNRFYQTIPIKE